MVYFIIDVHLYDVYAYTCEFTCYSTLLFTRYMYNIGGRIRRTKES